MPDLVVSDLTVEYNSGGHPIRPLNQLSISAADGELVVLLGPSGCGKTTLLSCLAGLLTPKEGSITLGGTKLIGMGPKALADYRRRHVGVVFQAFNLIPSLTALVNVVAPMSLAGVGRSEARSRATELLTQVGPPTGCATGRARCPGGSSSGSPSPAPWSTTRSWCWRTSRPPTSTTSRSTAC